MHNHTVAIAAVLCVLAPTCLRAGSFTQNFDSFASNAPSGAINTNLNLNGASTAAGTLNSSKKETNNTGVNNVGVVKTGVGSGAATALRLAEKGTGTCVAAYWLPVLDAALPVDEFTVTLDLLMDKTSAATVPADGFNISFGLNLSGQGGAAGHPATGGLVINFDTYENSIADPRSIEILADGASVGNFLATGLPGGNFTYDQTFRQVILHWDAANGLDLTYNGQVIFNNQPTPGFLPVANGNFAFNAATGGLNQDVFIDNLSISTTPTPVINTTGVVIEEFMTDNADGLEDEDLDQPDWVELYNGTVSTVVLTNWYLSNDAGNLTKWKIPALSIPSRSYAIIFASGKDKFTNVRPHTNFTLEKQTGTIILTQTNGTTIVDQVSYGQQKEDISYGKFGVAQTPGFFERPTPGARNSGRQAANFRPSDPVFSRESGVLTASTTLSISLPPDAPPGAEIRYNLNSYEPTEASTLYTAPISITTSKAVKARVFAPGYLPSRMGNRSFIMLSTGANNVGSNYNGSGQPFSSSLPVIVMDSYLLNIDALTNPAASRPHQFTQAAIYDVNPGTGRAVMNTTPTAMVRSGTHVRGQSSSGQTERPYAWEIWNENADTDRDIPMLGFPEDSDWVLMTLTLDKALMRNYLMQQLLLDADGPGAGVRCRFVEVFFNQNDTVLDYSDYRGVYLLMEKLKRGRERVNIAKLNDSMSAPALINGGYIIKNDKTPYAAKFNPNTNGSIPGSGRDYDIYEPEPPTAAQISAIKTWFDQMTSALAAGDFNNPVSANYYGKWLDVQSFIDKTLWYELCKEVDSYTFSYYFSKDRNGPLRAYPFWDVDRGLGNTNYGGADSAYGSKWWYAGSNYTYYTRLDDDAEFNKRYWDRWFALRRTLFDRQALFNRIEATYSQLTEGSATAITNTAAPTLQVPAARHYRKYQILGTNSFGSGMTGQVERTTYRQEVDAMKLWISDRLEWVDRSAPLLAPILLNSATSQPQYGGNVSNGYQFKFDNPNSVGTVLYTIDGPDPRQTGGAQDPAALTATATTITKATLFNNSQPWKWILPGSAPSATWKNDGFDDSSWTTGNAPLGYGEASGLSTNISPTAPNYTAANAEPGPAYLRTTFNASGIANLTAALLEIQVDDGAVVYLNGQELARAAYPYPPTPPSHGQEASGPIDPAGNRSDSESIFYPITIDRTKLRDGSNTLAVEVHQAIYSFPPNGTFPNNTFSDMRFDCRLIGITATGSSTSLTLNTPGAHVIRSRVKNGSIWGPLTEAVFVVDAVPASAANLVVSEFHYHPVDPSNAEEALGFNAENDFEFIELQNISTTQAVDLSGVVIQDAVDFSFASAATAARYLPPGGRVVVVENTAGFAHRLLPGPAPIVAGAYLGNLSNGGETITIRNTATGNSIIKQFAYSDEEPWSFDADGFGYTLVLNNPAANPDHTLAASWHASAKINGDPGNADSSPFPAAQSWNGDSDGDGLSDGVEYAMGDLGADPPIPFSYSQDYAPPMGVEEPYLYFRFQRNLDAGAVTYVPELSSNLSAWDAAALVYVDTFHNPDNTAQVTYRSAQPVSALPSRVFLRLRVTR